MSWRIYEQHITEHLKMLYPDALIEHDVRRRGIFSHSERQIDILISGSLAGFSTDIAIDCKYFSTKIDIGIVEQFIAFLADLRVSKGVIVTNVGFSEAALRRARNEGRDIDVVILDFEDLDSFNGIGGATMYKDDWGVIVPCPSGWEMHREPHPQRLCIYSRPGIHWRQAYDDRELIYPEISSRTEMPQIEDLLEFHRRSTTFQFPNAKFEYDRSPGAPFRATEDRSLLIRRIDYEEYTEPEISVFITFPTFYFFLVLLAPEKQMQRNLKKLAFMAKMALPIQRVHPS
ncbi:restriction endonuclease [Verrucomicrobium sp. BvORR106]|uniref:restriction endonuclease n=1 Tax=Verrucomicrobium sp. BvORR106 TaxID=1403819 RepID=UPI00068BF427|nr:restriction endonuclease [Verrucomicrobium sp. BvORR106]